VLDPALGEPRQASQGLAVADAEGRLRDRVSPS
jgi:hypothetical protein